MDLIKRTTPINEGSNWRTYYVPTIIYRVLYRYIYRNRERSLMNTNDFYDEIIKENLHSSFIPMKFEDISEQYLIISNKDSKIKTTAL